MTNLTQSVWELVSLRNVDRLFRQQWLVPSWIVSADNTVVTGFYDRVLKRPLKRIWRVRPELFQSGQCNLFQANDHSHTAIHVSNFLAKSNVTVLEHPPYSPDLAPIDFFFLPASKVSWKAYACQTLRRINNVWQRLEVIADGFQQLYNRCLKCFIANGDYFECSKGTLFVTLVSLFY